MGLYKNGKGKHKSIARLVAEAFIPNPDNKPEVDHINTLRMDNSVENLRWVTHKENCNNPLTKQNMKNGQTGKKLSEETKLKISKTHKSNTFSKGRYGIILRKGVA